MIQSLFFILIAFHLEAIVYPNQSINDEIAPFDELILSWNGPRPREGECRIEISLKTEGWSPWMPYAVWGREGQGSFKTMEGPISIEQDTLSTSVKATGYQVRVVPENRDLQFHVYTNADFDKSARNIKSSLASLQLPVKGISQMALDHPRAHDLCSPTSTTAVVSFLKGERVDPISFAAHAWDKGFDIYGNWVLNTAQASALLGPAWHVWVARLSGFEELHQFLKQGAPVVVSVRGPLEGSALPYAKGHLMVVTGYDAERHEVICMDPAFPQDQETTVRYPLEAFMETWGRRGRIAYCFSQQLAMKKDPKVFIGHIFECIDL